MQAKAAVFTAHVVPQSAGETGWADMRAAYDALPSAMREGVAKWSAYHSLYHSQGKVGLMPKAGVGGYGYQVKEAPLRPLVKVHPETGRLTLMIGRHAYGIPGLTDDASEKILNELMEFACQPPRVYHHHWSPGFYHK